jgi:hypothetical protein
VAEQTVITRMDVEGDAAQKVRDLGAAAKDTGKAVDEAQRELQRLFETGKGTAADFDRIIRGSRAGGAAGAGVGPAAANDIPRATLDAERRNRLNLQETFERDRVRFERQQERERKQQEKEAEDGAGGGAGGYKNPLAGTGFARVAAPLFILHTFTQVAEGIGKELQRIAVEGTGAKTAGGAVADMLGNVAGAAAESLPIIGGLFRTLSQASEVASGEFERRLQHGAAVRQVVQNVSVARAGNAAFEQAGQGIRGLEADQAAADIQARSARSQAGLLQAAPGLVQFLNPRIEPGQFQVGPGTAAARQGVFGAQADAAAARDLAADRQRRAAKAAADAKALEDQAKRAGDDAQGAQNRAEEARQKVAGRGGFGAFVGDVLSLRGAAGAATGVNLGSAGRDQLLADREAARKAEEEAATKTGQAQELASKATAAGKENLEAQKAAQDAVTKAAEAEGAVRRANLEVQRDKLNLLKSEEDTSRRTARTLGSMNEGELQSTLAAIEQIKAHGIETATDQQRAQVRQAAPEFIGKIEEERGQTGTAKQIQEATGQRLLGDVAKERQALAGTITIEAKVDEAQTKEAIGKALRDASGELKDAFLQLAKDAVRQVALDIQQQHQQDRLQQQQTR